MKIRKAIPALMVGAFGISPLAQAIEYDRLTVNGYLSFEYENHVSGDEEGDANGSFDLDLIDLVFNFQVTDKVRVAADLTWEHGTATEDERGNSAVEYAFVEFQHADWLRIKAGKMFTAFGIYNEVHTAKPAYLSVKEPLSTNKNNKLGSEIRFYPRWQTGVAVLGNTYFDDVGFDYVLQVSNGESEDVNPYEEDDNVHKAVTGRFRFGFDDSLYVGMSFYQDDMENADFGFGVENLEVSSQSLHLEYHAPTDTYVEFEYIQGDVKSDTLEREREAYSILVAQTYGQWTPYFRFESLDPDKDVDDDDATVMIAGVNYQYDDGVHVKLEFDQFDGDVNNGEYGDIDFVEFKASISVGF